MLILAGLVITGIAIPITISSNQSKALQEPLTALNTLTNDSGDIQIKQAISEVANKYGVEKNTMIALAECESGFRDICIIDTNGKWSCGFYMFQESTLKHFCPDLKWGKGHIKDNIVCAGRMIKQGIMSIHWVNCSKKILES